MGYLEKEGFLVTPQLLPSLDPEFRPAVLSNHKFIKDVTESGHAVPLVLGLERTDGAFSRFNTVIYDERLPEEKHNKFYVERILKFLLWQRGGWKIHLGGPRYIGKYISELYSEGGLQKFDYHFMSKIYNHPLTIITCDATEVPNENEFQKPIGRHLDGNRIGFDLGASDIKVSAVVDGQAVFSSEIEWLPSNKTDPNYHLERIQAALDLAVSKLQKIDAIGGSSAGVYINNCPMISSLFRGIPEEKYSQIRNMFLSIGEKMGVPLIIVNDGEVTALAGSMSLKDNGVLGISMGSSEAAGYVTKKGNITDWLNELAFAPVDFNPIAPLDEWSGDKGVGASYFSQQCVFRLAPQAGITVPENLTNAKKLEFVQNILESGDEGARKIWQSMGVYLGYTIAHYADFYDIRHILLLGRCTSGIGGTIMLESAKQVLRKEFPEIIGRINIQLPDEKSRRIGQSIAAASLPSTAQIN